MKKIFRSEGFTLVELLVVCSIIAILAGIVYANFGQSRASARDQIRKSSLEEVRLALELYKAQNGRYPAMGCPSGGAPSGGIFYAGQVSPKNANSICETNEYIVGLAPEFLPTLPIETVFPLNTSMGYAYRTNAAGTEYKFMVYQNVEVADIQSYDDEYARCRESTGSGSCPNPPSPKIYAVYTAGAATW